jgi:hypothetical protein
LPSLLFVRHIARGELFSAADVRGDMWPFRSEGFPPSRNWELTDVVTQFEPWDRFTAAELAAGRAPLWNPTTGAGAPHLANAQSAVLSPLTLLATRLGPRAGPLARAYLRVLCALAGMAVFLRGLGCGRRAALFGGIAFGFGGHELVWLAWPQSGVSGWLPWLLHIARRAARDAHPRASLLALPPVVALALAAGHPETAFTVVLGSATYFVFALSTAPGIPFGRRLGRLVAFGASGLLGAAIAAAAVLPFLSYLAESDALAQRSAGVSHGRPLLEAIYLFAPTFLGHPVDHTQWAGRLVLGGEIGTVALAALALALVPTGAPPLSRERRFFAGFALFALAATYGLPPLPWLLAKTPLLRMARDELFLVWFACAAAALGAIGLDAILRGAVPPGFARTMRFRATIAAISVAIALLVGMGVGALRRFLVVDAALGRPPGAPDLRPQGEIVVACALSLAAAAAIAACSILLARRAGRGGRGAAIAAASLLLVEVADAGFLAHERYLPRTPAALAERRSPALDALAAGTRGRVLLLGSWTARPNVAADAGIEDPRIYDAILLRRYALFEAALGPVLGAVQEVGSFHEPFLDLLSIDRVAEPWDRDIASEEVPVFGAATDAIALEPGRAVEVALGRVDFGAAGVTLRLAGTRGEERLSLALREGARTLATREVPARYAVPGAPFVIPFPVEAPVADGPLALVLEAHGGPVVLLGGPDGRPAIGLRRRAASGFPVVAEGALRVHSNARALPHAFVVPRARRVRGPEEAIASLASGACDPRREALLEGRVPETLAGSGTTDEALAATVVESHPGFARIALPEGARGVLVVSECWDEGWHAWIDGAETPVVPAFAALQGIVLPEGAREAVMRYEPASWIRGVRVSVGALALWAVLVAAAVLGPRVTSGDSRRMLALGE